MSDADTIKALQRVVAEQEVEMQAAWSALKSCDFHLDEFASGACRVPPTAGPLAVPEAVRQCVDALHLRLAEARAQVAALTADVTAADAVISDETEACAAVLDRTAAALDAGRPVAVDRHVADVLRGQADEIRQRLVGMTPPGVAIAKAVAAEREACARVIESLPLAGLLPDIDIARQGLVMAAAAIRARGGQ